VRVSIGESVFIFQVFQCINLPKDILSTSSSRFGGNLLKIETCLWQ